MTAMEKKVGRETLLDLVNDKVMEAAAKEYGIEVSDKEIDLELALIRSVDESLLYRLRYGKRSVKKFVPTYS